MYLFRATYYSRDFLEEGLTVAIEIDTAGVEMTEKEVFVLAMEKAYDKSAELGKEWALGSVEFISC